MAKLKYEDPTKSFPKPLQGIRNPDLYSNTSSSSIMSDEEFKNLQRQYEGALIEDYNAAHGSMGYSALNRNPTEMESHEYGELNNFGSSTYDKPLFNATYEDVQNQRAYSQSGLEQLGSGILKGVTTAATTFADGVVGTIVGLANLAGEASKGNVNSFKEGFNAFVENPFSKAMQQINDSMESLLPNYYSTKEVNDPWYKHILSANFIGDKFLKNLGFTVGAAYSGKLAFAAGSKLMKLNKLREAFKGAVATSTGKSLEESAKITKAYLQGDAVMDGIKITEDLAKSAKTLNNRVQALKIMAGISAASGEARIEAISGTKEWYKLHEQQLTDAINQDKQVALQQLAKERPNEFIINSEGKITPVTTQAQQELSRRYAILDEKYKQGQNLLKEKATSMSNVIYALNIPLLSASNIFQFGKFMAGGYNTGRLANNIIKGTRKTGYSLNKEAINAQKIKAVLGSPIMEGQEEMSQQWIQEIPTAKYSADLNTFYGRKIDPEAQEKTIDWATAVARGFTNSYGSMKQWEQGFIGAITGALGAPKLRMKTNENGKKRLTLTNDGELYASLREARELSKMGETAVNALNNSSFSDHLAAAIRRRSLETDMERAIEQGKPFDYKNAESAELVNEAILRVKTGTIQETYDDIEAAKHMTPEQIQEFKENSVDKSTKTSIWENASDEEIQEHVAKQADKIKDKIDKYVKISQDLKTLYGERVSDDTLEEMTWMLTQIDDWEGRGQNLVSQLRDLFQDKADELKEKFGVDVNVILNNYEDFKNAFLGNNTEEKSEDAEDTPFVDLLTQINEIVSDKNLSLEEQNAKIQERIVEAEKELSRVSGRYAGNLRHIRKLAKQRTAALQKAYAHLGDFYALEDSEKEKVKQDYKQALEDLSKEFEKVHESSTQGHYEKLKLDDLRVQAVDLFESTLEKTQDIDAAFRAAESVLEKELLKLSSSEENAEGVSEWQRSRENMAKIRMQNSRSSLFSQISALTEMLQSNNGSVVSPIEGQKAMNSLLDLFKIIAAREHFINKYQQLTANPEAFTEEALKEREKAAEAIKNKLVDKCVEELEKATTLEEIRKIMKEYSPDIISEAFEKIKAGDNTELKELINQIEEYDFFRENIINIINSLENTPENTTAAGFIYELLNNFNTISEIKEELKGILEDDIDEDIKKALINILEQYDEVEKLKKSKERKEKKKKKELKKKSKKKKKEDSEEETKEGTEEKSKSKEKGFSIDSMGTTEEEDDEETRAASKTASKTVKTTTRKKVKKTVYTTESLRELIDSKADRVLKGILTASSLEDVLLDLDIKEDQLPEENDLGTIVAFAENILQKREKAGVTKEESEPVEEETEEEEVLETEPSETKEEDDDSTEEILEDEEEKGLDIINTISEYDDKSLEKLSKAKVIKGVKEDLVPLINKAATQELEKRKTPDAIEDSEDEIGNSENDSVTSSNAEDLRSWAHTEYEISPLKEKLKRKAVPYNSKLVKELRKLGVYEFINNGSLGVLFQNNNNLSIHFITTLNNEHIKTPLLAVELTDAVKRQLKAEGLSPINPIKIEEKEYQIVGSVGYKLNNETAKDHFENLIALLNEELEEKKAEEDYAVSQYTTTIKHIYSGRIVKSDSTSEEIQRSLKEILSTEKPQFYVYYNKSKFYTTLNTDKYKLQRLNPHSDNPREGSVWLVTREADGIYYCKSLRVERLDSYDWEENKNTPIVTKIQDLLTIICDPRKSIYDRAMAKLELQEYIYFPEGQEIYFKDDIISIGSGENLYEDNIGEDASTVAEKVEEVLSVLTEEDLSLRFNIATRRLDDSEYVEELINSNILSTNLLKLHNVNGSFDINPLDSNGKIIESSESKEGHTGSTKKAPELSTKTVYHNGGEFLIDSEGNVTTRAGEKVTDVNSIAEIKFNLSIREKEVTPYPGSENLYIGNYPNGEEFGVINYKIIDSIELTKRKKEADKKEEQRKTKIKVTREAAEDNSSLFVPAEDITEDDSETSTKEETDSSSLDEGIGLVATDDIEEQEEETDEKEEDATNKIGDFESNDLLPKLPSTSSQNSEFLNLIANSMFETDEEGNSLFTIIHSLGLSKPVDLIEFFAKNNVDINKITTTKQLITELINIRDCK